MKNKHLTFQDRVLIEDLLNRGNANLTTIAKAFGRDVSTISKEIKKHLVLISAINPKKCVKKQSCTIKGLGCKNCIHKEGYLCSHCGKCEEVCKAFDPVCPKRLKPPYACNGCNNNAKCRLEKGVYRAKAAQEEYEKELKSSRALTALNKAETYYIDSVFTPALKKGQSIHHIYEANKEDIHVCEKTLYNMAHQEILSVSLLDLPRTVQRRIPKEYKYKNPKGKAILEGRTYMDYLSYTTNAPYEVLQLDTVIGNPKGKALITMEFIRSKLLLAFLVPEKSMYYVSRVFYTIREILKSINLTQTELMPVILTDNGTEFNNPLQIECDENGEVLSRVFYCSPNAPFQKGHLENNHTNLRRILPKGASFDNLTQEQINTAVSHINGLIRSSCMNKSAYDMFCYLHQPNGEAILTALGIEKIPMAEVTLNPSIIKRK